jgi:NAD(P)-dependent dehydrogenase (short-subunit alcohol dehydrogenase family)
MGDLADARVVVVGGSSGMGFATARLARDAGASVRIVGRDRERLLRAAHELGDSVDFVAADAANEAGMEQVFADLDRVDHVVVFAGEQPQAPLAEAGLDLFRRAMEARVWGALNACKFAAPKMPASGSFTFCSGLSAHRPRVHRSVGASATAALESFGRAMAVELAPVRVNTICPGAIDTPLLDRVYGDKRDEAMAAVARRVPAGRLGRAEEIADAALFLMRNGYVTGITLPVDGGVQLL